MIAFSAGASASVSSTFIAFHAELVKSAFARRIVVRFGLLVFCLTVAGIASAAEWVPTRPLHLILPFPPGGSTDLLGRMIALPLGDALGQQIVSDNRGGAGGIIGMGALARAQPDGYTFAIHSLSAHAGNATLAANLPYDSIKDFQPLTFIAESPLVLAVNPTNPAQSVEELLAQAKAKSRTLNFASGGIGLAGHIAGEILKIQSKADLIHLPYKGGGPAMVDVMGGQVDMVFVPQSSVLPLAQSKKLRVLAIASKRRSAHLPGVMTMPEAGFPNLVIAETWGMLAPANILPAAARRLRAETVKVLQKADILGRLNSQGTEISTSTPEQLRDYITGEISRYRDIIQRAGIKAN